jgi:hypothetical protein
METIPNEIIKHIFDHLSSKDRSLICSVSSKFNKISLESSNFNEFIEYDKYIIYKQQNYHVLVRLKNVKLLDLREACIINDYDMVELSLRILNKFEFFELLNTFNYVCLNGYFNIVKLLVDFNQKKGSMSTYQLGFLCACKKGHLSIVELLMDYSVKKHIEGFICAYENGYLNIVKLLEKSKRIDWMLVMDHSCKTGKINIVKYIVANKKIFNPAAYIHLCERYDQQEIMEFLIELETKTLEETLFGLE